MMLREGLHYLHRERKWRSGRNNDNREEGIKEFNNEIKPVEEKHDDQTTRNLNR